MTSDLQSGDVVFRRFRRLLRHYWWVPAGLGLALGFGLAFAEQGRFEASGRANAIERSVELQSAGFAPDVLSQQLPISVDAASILSSDVESDAAQAVDAPVTATVTVGNDPQSVSIAVVSDSATSAAAARDFYLESLMQARTERYQALVDAVAGELASTRTILAARVQQLDEQLASVDDPSGNLSGALVTERSRAAESLTRTDRQAAALEAVRSRPSEILEFTTGASIVELDKWKLRFAAGVSFGALLGLAALYIVALLDTKVRSADDLLSAGLTSLGALPRSPAPQHVGRIGSVVASLARERDRDVVNLLPADDDERLNELLPDVAKAVMESSPGIGGRTMQSLDVDPAVLADEGLFVVVARFGSTRVNEIEQVARDLELSGRSSGVALLVDVPGREIVRASGGDRRRPGNH